MKRFIRIISICMACYLGFPRETLANDTMMTLGAGGLIPEKSSEITMVSEDLQISTQKISIRYRFRNTSSHDIDTVVAFPLPEVDGGNIYHEPVNLPNDQDIANFVNFKVMEDGRSIPVRMELRAFSHGKDITSRLHALGISGTVLIRPLQAELRRLSSEKIRALEKQGLLTADGENSTDVENIWANWTMHVQFYWTQHFPVGKTVELTQTYSPVVGGSFITRNYDGSLSIKPYCGRSADLAQIKRVQESGHQIQENNPQNEITFYENSIDYILTTARNWRGSIGNFRLSIQADTPEDMVLTCFPGIRKVSPTLYEVDIKNFSPSKELSVLILKERPR
jgi:Domain of unknown function (DUF4424)